MRFAVLGTTRAWHADGRPVPLGGARLRALLAALALEAGRVVTTERLIDGVYGESPPTGAANALQSQVSRLRQSVPVTFEGAGYRLAADPDDVDAHRFARLAAEGRRALTAGNPRRAVELLSDALRLWDGEPLKDLRDAPFAAAAVARLTELRLAATEDLLEARLATEPTHGTPTHDTPSDHTPTHDTPSDHTPTHDTPSDDTPTEDLVASLRELVASHPLRERAHLLLMRALAATGRRAEALTAFQQARQILADELGADPSPTLAALHTALLRETATETGTGTATTTETGTAITTGTGTATETETGRTASPRHNLPSQLTTFVGRSVELGRIAAALRAARLVTLHGPGGAGKTRLAVEAAGRYDGDVCFVELASADGDETPRAVLAALGIRDAHLRDRDPRDRGPGPAATERLVAALASRELLLVLDNCEHVVAAAAALVARLLAAAPGLRVLATSREPLGITGEALCPVAGLPVSSLPASSLPASSLQTPSEPDGAVQLFVERAADVTPGFTLTAENRALVDRICRMLDGLPLAVELAAARLHALPLDELAARLDDRFRLLTRGSRTADSRHRTLQAVVAWSWDLLTGPERTLARRFSVFAGGADLAAIEQVCGAGMKSPGMKRAGMEDTGPEHTGPEHSGPEDTGPETVELLADLVGKSLIERDGARYRMLTTIGAYCAERLSESGERDELRRAHARHFLRLARTADARLRTREQLAWLDRLDADRDNLHAALRRSAAEGDPGTALQLIAALSFYWWLRGLRTEATALAERVLREVGEPPPGLSEEYVACVLTATLGGARPRDDSWERFLDDLQGPPRQPFLLYLSAMAVGPPNRQLTDILEVNRQMRERLHGDAWSDALGAVGAGWLVFFAGGRAGGADAEFEAALDGFRRLGERWGMMLALSGLAEAALWRGDAAAARAPLDEALRLAGELGSTVDVADVLRARAETSVVTGDLAGAAADFARSASLGRDCGAPEMVAAAELGLGALALRRADLDEARRRCVAALAACPSGWSADGTRMTILVTLGRIAEAGGDVAEAGRRYREALTARPGMLSVEAMADAMDGLARLAARSADAERAAVLLGAAATIRSGAPHTEPPPVSEAVTAVRAALGDDAYAAAHARGAQLGLAAADLPE